MSDKAEKLLLKHLAEILTLNELRNAKMDAPWNPVTGENSILERRHVRLEDFSIPDMWLPLAMLQDPFIAHLLELGSIEAYLDEVGSEDRELDREKVVDLINRTRCLHDFAYWAFVYVMIKPKSMGNDIHFLLNNPQRILVTVFEEMRLAGVPIRVILLKARQWGGSTVTQVYMAWIQLVHLTNVNSLIVGHEMSSATEVQGMFDKLISYYPTAMLHQFGDAVDENEVKIHPWKGHPNIEEVPARPCRIKIGSAERPNSARGGDYTLVHCTEIGLWKATDGKTPEDIIQSATSGVENLPLTLIVYESTAKGVGNTFHAEYTDAADPETESMFRAVFIAWFQIEKYRKAFESEQARIDFATWLYNNRNNANARSNREEPGTYLWYLWEAGASLEGINWYITERRKYRSHARMAEEFPSNDIEAFNSSGSDVFDRHLVERLRRSCKALTPITGELQGDAREGAAALRNLHFVREEGGCLSIWSMPEIDPEEPIKNRYLVSVDVGGRGHKADYSVITVFDRIMMMEAGKPSVVAQWYGHIDHDILAWKAAQIASFYDNALLVIESNTLETRDKQHDVDGDQSAFILVQIKNVYKNLYARRQSEDDIRNHRPVRYGWHTNVGNKATLISSLVRCVRDELYIERDERALNEYIVYEKKKNGAYGAKVGYHDDLLMARAIGLYICFYEMELPRIINPADFKGLSREVISAASF